MDVDSLTMGSSTPFKMEAEHQESKTTYKSMKKKYRKMRLKFEQRMAQSTINYREEARALETARRLAIENDQLLDLLLDVNSSAQIPPQLRIDIVTESPALSALPALIPSSMDPSIEFPTPEGQAIYDEIRQMIDSKMQARTAANLPPKSLANLLSTFPPLPLDSLDQEQANDLTLPKPIAYLTLDEIDEHITQTDLLLSLPPQPTMHNPHAIPRRLSDKELESKNPNSVYHWLRLHEPQVFLQDGEDTASATASGKPGSLRGAGKRVSLPAPTRVDAVQFVEEDGMGYDGSLGAGTPIAGSSKGDKTSGGTAKRKRVSEEDVGYRPKGGSSRPSKKKKSGGENVSGKSAGGRQSTGGGKGKAKTEKGAVPEMDLDEVAGEPVAGP